MKNRSALSGSGLFLIELLLAILVFSVASAVCLNIFVTANQASLESSKLNQAVIAAQNAAECFKAVNGDMKSAAGLLDGNLESLSDPHNGTLELYFDSAWNPVPQGSSHDFVVRINSAFAPGADCADAEVTVADAAGSLIFSIPVTVIPSQEVVR